MCIWLAILFHFCTCTLCVNTKVFYVPYYGVFQCMISTQLSLILNNTQEELYNPGGCQIIQHHTFNLHTFHGVLVRPHKLDILLSPPACIKTTRMLVHYGTKLQSPPILFDYHVPCAQPIPDSTCQRL